VRLTSVPVESSPKSQTYCAIWPSGSDEPEPSKVISSPAAAVYGPPGLAVGLRFMSLSESSSFTAFILTFAVL